VTVGPVASLRAGFAEVFLLREAEKTVASYDADVLAELRAKKAAARVDQRAARRTASPYVALELLDHALPLALGALHLARHASSPFSLDAELAWLEAESAAPPSEALLVAARVREAPADFGAAETRREQLDELIHLVLRGVEARTPLELHALRYGRLAAVLVALVALVGSYAHKHWMVHNVALHKPVVTSSLKQSPPTGAELVDGHERGTFGVHTNEGHPFVMIDLERRYLVRSVRIFNRGDGWFDDVLPLTLSVSTDGAQFVEVAKRTEHFDVWDVDLGGRDARFVRVSKDSGYIALNAIEVFARE
jgi:F5/8 type C domain-containing protein